MHIFDLLLSIEHKSKLFIGNDDLLALKHFIDGCCIFAEFHNIEYGEKDLQGFDTFVHQHFNETRTISLYQCIQENASSREAAFSQFYLLLHQYIELSNSSDISDNV